jgi:hypothetical protein
MTEPDYKRPFDTQDFRGYFRWTDSLTKSLRGNALYHACHRNELEIILKKDELGLRGSWSLHLPQHGLWKAPGVWTGLNYYVNGNHYGPFVLEFPLSILNGKHFMVFRRTTGRQRHFFVQYEAHIPIYSFGTTLWRSVNPFHYFENAGVGAIWDIILTEPIPIDEASINPVEHPKCIPGKCSGSGRIHNRKTLREIAKAEFKNMLLGLDEYSQFLNRFSDAAGLSIDLPSLDDDN